MANDSAKISGKTEPGLHIDLTRLPSMFPPVDSMSDDDGSGALCISRRINTAMLTDAYCHGIFPWPFEEESVLWCSPAERGILPMEHFHIPHGVKRMMKQNRFSFSVNRDFGAVIDACASVPRIGENGESDATWITNKLRKVYREFHKMGFAHSFEAYDNETGELAGGLYGISLGGVFCGESMFHRVSGASQFAFVRAAELFRQGGVRLIDTQMVTNLTGAFGAFLISRSEYLELLGRYGGCPVDFTALFHAQNEHNATC